MAPAPIPGLPRWNSMFGELNPIYVAIGGTLFLILIAGMIVALVLRRNRLNWYERNLLEIAQADPEYIRYKLKHQDTETSLKNAGKSFDESDDEMPGPLRHSQSPTGSAHRGRLKKQQSRIYTEEEPRKLLRPVDIPADISEKFVVPKSRSHGNISMFHDLDRTKFNRELYDIRQDSSASEEQVVGECGSLKMALSYDVSLSLLTVQLRQAAELTAPRADGPPNPYFTVTLQKAEPSRSSCTQQSKVYRQTSSPELTDEFYFDVPIGIIDQCKLEVLVYDFDQCSVDECIGYCWLTLGRLEISTDAENPVVFWAEILPMLTSSDSFGEILFSVAYLAKAQRLTVSVFKARKLLQPPDLMTSPDPAVRVTVLCSGKKLKRKKTSAKKGTVNPIYNEALTFAIPKCSLCDIVLDIEIIHDPGYLSGAIAGTKIIGRISLPLSRCKDLWRAVIRGENSQSRWYPLEKIY